MDHIRPLLAARSAAAEAACQSYLVGVPINTAGHTIQADPIAAWLVLVSKNVPIDVCQDTETERNTAFTLLRSRPSLILDPLTFWLAGSFGVLDALRTTFGPPGLTAATMDLLRERAAEPGHPFAGSGSIWEKDGQIGMIEHSEQDRLERQAREAGIAGWAERNAVIVPAIPAADLHADMRTLGAAMHPSIIDTISAASGSGRVMLAEDRRLRQLAEETANVRGCWMQVAMQVSREAGHLDEARYRNTTLDLTLLGHRLTTMDGFDLLCAAKRGSWRTGGIFSHILKIVTAPTVEIRSLSIVTTTFLVQLWRRPQSRRTKEALTAAVLASCAATHPKSLPLIASLLDGIARNDQRRMSTDDARLASAPPNTSRLGLKHGSASSTVVPTPSPLTSRVSEADRT